MLGWLMAFYGFIPNIAQSARALFGINLAFSLLPGLFALLSGLAIFFYRLDEPLVKQIERDLQARSPAPPSVG
jgi:GPH family glycoside/pentoside/hexuronide:cation symporter